MRSATSRTSTPSTRSRRTRRCSSAPARRCRTAARSSTRSRTRPTRWCSRTSSIAATRWTPTRCRSTLTEKAGYAPGTLAAFLTRLDERNKDQPAQNGLFASHPETKERIDAIKKLAGAKTGAAVEARYKENVKYEPTPVTAIAHRRGRRRRPDRLDQAEGRKSEDKDRRTRRRGAEERLRPRRAEAGILVRAPDRAGVGLGRVARSRAPIAPRKAAAIRRSSRRR